MTTTAWAVADWIVRYRAVILTLESEIKKTTQSHPGVGGPIAARALS